MLQVLNAGTTELSRTERESDIFLNCWDKSSPLIKELERTVNFAERKCGDLMQQLNFYKEYYQKWAQVERVNTCCKKKQKKNLKTSLDIESSSENEFEKVNQYLYKKIKNKINEMNNEIIEANRKLNCKKEIRLETPIHFSSKKSKPDLKESKENLEEEEENLDNKRSKSDPIINQSLGESKECHQKDEIIKVKGQQSSKSVPGRGKTIKLKSDKGISRKRYSSLQRYKIRSKSLPQGVRRKFGFGGFFEVFEPETREETTRTRSKMSLKVDSCTSSKSRKSLYKTKMKTSQRRCTSVGRNFRQAKSKPDEPDVRTVVKNIKHEPPVVKREQPPKQPPSKQQTCRVIVPTSPLEDNLTLNDNLKTLMAKPNAVLPFLRHPIPFIPCSSTSKTFNLGLNVQQVLSLIKHKKHSVTLQAVVKNSMQAARSLTEPTVGTLFISQTTTRHTSAICPAREGSEDTFSIVTDNRSKCSILRQLHTNRSQTIEEKLMRVPMEITKPERPEDVWVVEQPDSTSGDVRKIRSKCTCFPSKHCVDYHKVLRQYTAIKMDTANKNGYPSMITCTKSRLYTIPSQENVGSDSRIELTKVQNDLVNLTRKYSSLQEQISQKCLDDYEANAELDAMESELAVREVEFKDILNFYNQLMSLKEKLKSLRAKNQNQPQSQRPKKDPLRPTPSMALTRALRKIQGLQDKIKLIDNL